MLNASPVIPAAVQAVIDGKVKSAAARKFAAEYARETLAAAAAAVVNGADYAAALAPVTPAAAALAAALSGTKDGQEVSYSPVPTAVLLIACVTFKKDGHYTVKGCGFIRSFAKVGGYVADDTVPAAVLPDDAYRAAKKPAASKPAARSPFEQFAARMYSMEKAADKAATPVDKIPTFPTFTEWLTDEKKANLAAAAAVLGIAA